MSMLDTHTGGHGKLGLIELTRSYSSDMTSSSELDLKYENVQFSSDKIFTVI